MNLSIFSSKTEVRAIVGVVLLLLACEGFVRVAEVKISNDISHIREMPAIVERLRNANSPRVLFLGNSLTRDGVDLQAIRQAVRATAEERLALEGIYPDDTTICDWYYVYRTFLVNRDVAPNLVVVGYIRSQLEDEASLRMGRLGAYFGGWSALSEAFRDDIPGVGDRIQYLISSVSLLFANRERIRDRLLDFIIPDYRRSARLLNGILLRRSQKPQERNQPTYQRLRRFIRLVQTNGTKLVLVAMPMPDPYPIADVLRSTVAGEGGMLLDLRYVSGLARTDFPDRYHLSPSGAKIYSSALATDLQKLGLL